VEGIYASKATEDLHYWVNNSPKLLAKINHLIEAIQTNPFASLGRPEALRFEKTGYWSRRINHEHRVIYKVANNKLYIAQCRLSLLRRAMNLSEFFNMR
jgi:toxin YoeB